jgi:hypothetical protein
MGHYPTRTPRQVTISKRDPVARLEAFVVSETPAKTVTITLKRFDEDWLYAARALENPLKFRGVFPAKTQGF